MINDTIAMALQDHMNLAVIFQLVAHFELLYRCYQLFLKVKAVVYFELLYQVLPIILESVLLTAKVWKMKRKRALLGLLLCAAFCIRVNHVDVTTCNGSVAACSGEEEEFLMESEVYRRFLETQMESHIDYGLPAIQAEVNLILVSQASLVTCQAGDVTLTNVVEGVKSVNMFACVCEIFILFFFLCRHSFYVIIA